MKGNKDLEYIALRNKVLLTLLIVSVFAGILLFAIYKKIDMSSNSIDGRMNKNQSFVIYVDSNNCKNCTTVEQILNKNGIVYTRKDVNSLETKEFLQKNKITNMEEVAPAVIYVKDGKMYSSLFDIEDMDELQNFLEYYQLTN